MEPGNHGNSPSNPSNWYLSDLVHTSRPSGRKPYSNDISRGLYEDSYLSGNGYNHPLNRSRRIPLSSPHECIQPVSLESDITYTIAGQDEVSDYFLDLPDVVYDYSRDSSLHPYDTYSKPRTSGGLLDLHGHSRNNRSNNLGSRGSQQENQTSHRTAISQQHLHSSVPPSRDSMASSHRLHFSNNDIVSYQPYGNEIDCYSTLTPTLYPHRTLEERYQETSRHLHVKSSPIFDEYPISRHPYGISSVTDDRYDIVTTQRARPSMYDPGRKKGKRREESR